MTDRLLEYRSFVIEQSANGTYSFALGGYTFVFRSLNAAKSAADRYYATWALPCEVYTCDGLVIDAERGGEWLGER